MVSIISTGSPTLGPVQPQFNRLIEEVLDGTRAPFPVNPNEIRAGQIEEAALQVAEITGPDQTTQQQQTDVINNDQPFESTSFATQLISQSLDTIEALANAAVEQTQNVAQSPAAQADIDFQQAQAAGIEQSPISAAFQQLLGAGAYQNVQAVAVPTVSPIQAGITPINNDIVEQVEEIAPINSAGSQNADRGLQTLVAVQEFVASFATSANNPVEQVIDNFATAGALGDSGRITSLVV